MGIINVLTEFHADLKKVGKLTLNIMARSKNVKDYTWPLPQAAVPLRSARVNFCKVLDTRTRHQFSVELHKGRISE